MRDGQEVKLTKPIAIVYLNAETGEVVLDFMVDSGEIEQRMVRDAINERSIQVIEEM